MSADVFSLGETHLEKGEEIHFNGYTGVFASHGKGKGVSTFYNIECAPVNSITSEKYSGIQLRFIKFDAIFLYLSSGCNKEEILNHLESWIVEKRPTVIMGDINIDYDKSNKLIKALEGSSQLLLRNSIDELQYDSDLLVEHIFHLVCWDYMSPLQTSSLILEI